MRHSSLASFARLTCLAVLLLVGACTANSGAGGGGGSYYIPPDIIDLDTLGDTSLSDVPGPADSVGQDSPAVGTDANATELKTDTASCTGTCCKTPADCDDGNPCTSDLCNAGTGACSHAAIAGCIGSAQPCDASHACGEGVCDLGSRACAQCLQSSDCGGSGLYCQDQKCKSGSVCKSDIDCKAAKQVCAKQDGVCVDCNVPGDCGAGKACVDHLCKTAVPCSSSKDCAKVCDLEGGVCVDCLTSDDCTIDGQFCTAAHLCKPAVCTGGACNGQSVFACKADGSGYGAPEGCDDGNPCTTDACTPGPGGASCTHALKSGGCDDGNACTDNDACSAEGCLGQATDCDDNNPCTSDTCSPSSGCKHGAKNGGSCNDNDACTTSESCMGGTCQGQKLNCDDGNLCTTDSCGASSGCNHSVNAKACDDGTACTSGDSCKNGACTGNAKDCNDNNVCTTDACSPVSGCTHQGGFGACDDGNACTVGDTCSSFSGTCSPGSAKVCSDGNPCTSDSCSGGTCQYVNNLASCTDSDPCFVNDYCVGGKCVPGSTKTPCDDSHTCTDDACKTNVGCTFTNNTLACNDNNQCTENDVCKNGSCAPGTAKVCDDKDACTGDKCDVTKGCVATPDLAKCDDKNPCTADSCTAPGGACAHAPVANCCFKNAECDDKVACTIDVCAANACAHKNTCCSGTADCSDSNACTTDNCSGTGTCSQVALPQPLTPAQAFDFEASPEGWVPAAAVSGFGWTQRSGITGKTGQGAMVYGSTTAGSFSGLKGQSLGVVNGVDLQLLPNVGYTLSVSYRMDVLPVTAAALYLSMDMGGGNVWLVNTLVSGDATWKTATFDIAPIMGTKAKVSIKAQLSGSSSNPMSGTGIYVDAVTITAQCTPKTCTSASQCYSPVGCSVTSCVAGVCNWQVQCCTATSQCDDKNACTTDSCSGGKCYHTAIANCCNKDAECDDGKPCTWDACGTDKKCSHKTIADCCTSNSECDDADACSGDVCGANNTCSHPAICCKVNADCADGETTCTTDSCANGTCVHAPTNAPGCCTPVLYSESFDGTALPGWTLANSAGATKGWQLWKDATQAKSGKGVLYYGDPALKTFDFGATSGLATSALITIPTGTKPMLRFWLYMDTEGGMTYDKLSIYLLSGTQKIPVWDKNKLTSTQAWQDISFDLTPYVGKQVQVHLDFNTGDSVGNGGLGVLLDDLRVLNTCP